MKTKLSNREPADELPHVCQRAAAIWTLLLDFRADCQGLPAGEMSRRCDDLVEAMTVVEERIAARRAHAGGNPS